MTTLSGYKCASTALLGSLKDLKSYGTQVTVRGMTTRELLGYSFYVQDSRKRFTFVPFRKPNPFAQVAESLWMLAGRNDLDWLEFYIPSCKKWSDDGLTWRDAYGPRLRRYGQQYEVSGGVKYPVGLATDQLAKAVSKLLNDVNSRQIIMTIWNPNIDWVEGSKAYPCNIALQFMARDNVLHMFVTIRSNDVIYGFSHNDFFSWSFLHQMMAYWTDTTVGNLHWNAASFHIYERHYPMMNDIIQGTHPRQSMYDWAVPTLQFVTPFPAFDYELDKLFEWENYARETDSFPSELVDSLVEFSGDPFLDSCARMLMIYILHKRQLSTDSDNIVGAVSLMPYSDFQLAVIDYLCRTDSYNLTQFSHLIPTVEVYEFLNYLHKLNTMYTV